MNDIIVTLLKWKTNEKTIEWEIKEYKYFFENKEYKIRNLILIWKTKFIIDIYL
jgi:hypothetical protein